MLFKYALPDLPGSWSVAFKAPEQASRKAARHHLNAARQCFSNTRCLTFRVLDAI